MGDMKYWCATCERMVGPTGADHHSAEGHVILPHPDRAQDRPDHPSSER